MVTAVVVGVQLDTASTIISATVTATCSRESEAWNIQYRFYDILAAT